MGCTAEELLYGEGVGVISEPKLVHGFGKVPLISFEIAGSWNEVFDSFLPASDNQYIFCPPKHGPRSYAVSVSDDSMTFAQGKSYPQGSIVFADPDQVSIVASGDQVVAKLKDFSEVVFRKYVREGSKQYLQSLNQVYGPIHDDFEVLAKVIGKYEKSSHLHFTRLHSGVLMPSSCLLFASRCLQPVVQF